MVRGAALKIVVTWAVAVTALIPQSAHAEVVANCGATKGHAYYLQRGLVPDAKSGWKTDGITQGSTTVTRTTAGDYDVIFSDAMSRTISARADGAHIVALVDEVDTLALLVGYPSTGVTELYAFFRERGGGARMSMQQMKVGGDIIVQKTALYLGGCSMLR